MMMRFGIFAYALAGAMGMATPVVVQAQESPGVTDQSITLGSWQPLSGSSAAYGVLEYAGAQAYFALVNSRGGVKGKRINYIVDDNAFSAQRAVAIARKLVTRDNVLAICIPSGSAAIAATLPYLLKQEHVPVIFPYGSFKEWFHPSRENLYGLGMYFEVQADEIARWLHDDDRKNIFVLYQATVSSEGHTDHMLASVRTNGANIEKLGVKIDTTDWVPVVLEIKKRNPDAIVLWDAVADVIALSRELKNQGLSVPLYTYSWNAQRMIVDLGGDSVEGLKALSETVTPDEDTPAIREYRDALAKFEPDQKPDFISLQTFGMAKVFVEALERIDGPITRESLVKSLDSLKNYDSGIFPPITFDSTRHLGVAEGDMRRLQVVHGKWTSLPSR
jgi:branched-chain amino acid transport system substrate-binding protein